MTPEVSNAARESLHGTFETCRRTLRKSAFRGISEVPFQGHQDRLTRNGPRAALVSGAEIRNYEFEERLTLRGWIVSPRRSMAKSSVIFAARFSAVFAW
jgi:hypothetical protein